MIALLANELKGVLETHDDLLAVSEVFLCLSVVFVPSVVDRITLEVEKYWRSTLVHALFPIEKRYNAVTVGDGRLVDVKRDYLVALQLIFLYESLQSLQIVA